MASLGFSGTYTALVTPFFSDPGRGIDWDSFAKVVELQINSGVSGLVPCGTTGESPTLTASERLELVRNTVELARGRVPVIAGTGSACTRKTVEDSQEAERAGASAVMVVVPYYNRPTQRGLVEHFVAVAASVGCPVVAYNIPGRSGTDLSVDAVGEILSRAPNVVAIKEATGNVLRAQELVRKFGDRLTVLCGDDTLTLAMVAVGARGVISVTSNLLPGPVAHATRLALEGKLDEARRAHTALLPIHEAMFIESNPAPVKAAMASRGLIATSGVRLPLVEASMEAQAHLVKTLEAVGR